MDIPSLVNAVARVLINPAILLIFGVALVVFIWGLVRFLWAVNMGGKNVNTGKQHMLWGILGMTVMMASFGILKLIENTLASLK
jgi:hypothetical protein